MREDVGFGDAPAYKNATYDEPVKGVPCEDHFDGVGIWLLVATTTTRLKGILLFFFCKIFVVLSL